MQDFSGDGFPDAIVACNITGRLEFFLHAGVTASGEPRYTRVTAARLPPTVAAAAISSVVALVAGHLDDDGFADVIVVARVCQRLLLEAAALASVSHEYVVRVFGVVTASGATDTTGHALSPCLVMELFEGRPLQQFVREEALSLSDKVRLLQHIAIGLAEIHDRGLVHGDMTSNNVLARRDVGGVAVRIIDFGMSSVAVGGRGVGGTTAFMAPELLAVPDDDDDVGYVRWRAGVVACLVHVF